MMAQSIQNVTLSLTLPISCLVCLGKVRRPVICSNNHVFCSTCIEEWLKRNSQCPTCRIPITSENPCREIIGASNECETSDSRSVRKHLRKTRLELLHKEFEDEIETLQNENEELRNKNLNLELQLKPVLYPANQSLSSKSENAEQKREDKTVDPGFLEEWTSKLKAASDLYEKVKTDMEKLKEANKNLRAQNIDLVRENLRLKAEVENRSPQKFGRFTVAALEAKIDQYERDANRLRKALERSDKYIEELENQISLTGKKVNDTDSSAEVNSRNDCKAKKAEDSAECFLSWSSQNEGEQSRILTMRKSLSEMEQPSVSSLDRPSIFSSDLDLDNELLEPEGLLLTTTTKGGNIEMEHSNKCIRGESTPGKKHNSTNFEHLVNLTPSLSFSCLRLSSPSEEIRRKPLSYLRKLNFDSSGCGQITEERKQAVDKCNLDSYASREQTEDSGLDKQVFWNSYDVGIRTANSDQSALPEQLTGTEYKNIHSSNTTFQLTLESEVIRLRTSSEASMDAAYLDKISELDTMISESENSRSSHYSLMSTRSFSVDSTLIPDAAGCSELVNEVDTRLETEVRAKQHAALCSQGSGEEGKPATASDSNSSTSNLKTEFCLFESQESQIGSLQVKQDSDELSFDLLFTDSQEFPEKLKPGSLDSSSPSESNFDEAEPSKIRRTSVKKQRERSKTSIVQTIKRKTGGGLDIESPSKTTKLL
ncbi:ORC ubiquitin ligase 1 [Erpetoichthys calabaricus]|uniref:ORC ubiquitin ligase 1 n=1 Tax=Erpetoichthys calabaricus TaxID=27687 RepID=UPI002234BADE|nr:ORC ubiquitin ligase 1 [Erpetoichthys calabaricus]